MAGVILASTLALAPGIGHGTQAGGHAGTGDRALPALDQEALLRCMADERESRALLERHRQESEAHAATGRILDADRGELEALRDATDPHDVGAVERYNARAAAFDDRMRRHLAGLASLEAVGQAQRVVAQRYNANCGGRHYQPHTLGTATGRE